MSFRKLSKAIDFENSLGVKEVLLSRKFRRFMLSACLLATQVSFPALGANFLNYHTGHVITNPQIVMVYVGGWDNSAKSKNAQTVIERWITNIGGTKYFNSLSGYYQKTPATHVLNVPLTIVDRVFDPDTTNPMDARRVNAYLAPWLAKWPTNTIYFQVPYAGLQNNCGGASGCRGAFAPGGAGAAIVTAFNDDGTFNPGWSWLWFHELAETITDSDGTGWLSDFSGHEVGDLCDYPDSPWRVPGVRISLTPDNDAFQIAGVPVLAINDGSGGIKACSHAYSTSAELFGIGTYPYHLYHQHVDATSSVTNSGWNDWGTLGASGFLNGGPAVVSWGTGRVDVFNFDSAYHLRHGYVDASVSICSTPGGTPCVDNWGSAPAGYQFFGEPAVASRGPQQLDVFALARSTTPCFGVKCGVPAPELFQRVWHAGYDSGWIDRGAPSGVTIASGPAAAAYNPDEGAVFFVGDDNNIYRGTWTDTSFVWDLWSGAQSLNGSPVIWQGKPAAASWAPGRFDVLLIDTMGRLFDCGGDADKSWGNCSEWQPPSGISFSNSPAITQMGDQRLVVAARGSDRQGWIKEWNFATDTGPWVATGGRLAGAAVGLSSW